MASKNYTPYEIARLILHCLHNEASEQEEATLEEWLKESDANRRFYESMKSRSHFTKGLKEYSGYDSRQDWKLVRKGLARRKFDLSFSWKRYAAVFIGLFIASGIYWNLSRNPAPIQMAEVPQDSILPGFRQAYIELGTGEKIALGKHSGGFVKNISEGRLKENEEGLVMEKADSIQMLPQEITYGKIVVPRGGEYRITLADSTQVWLNSDSKLEFPLVFSGSERRVKLAGEAYFKVRQNKEMPFRIEVGGAEVCVLGTSFNVQYYGECMRTTLAEGAVAIDAAGNNYRLSPGEEASVANGKVAIEKVDVYERVAWTEGKFVFRDRRLEEVMGILQRWYDVEIFYQDKEVKELHFTGNIQRHATIGEVVRFLERTRLVHFNISGRTVIVSKTK